VLADAVFASYRTWSGNIMPLIDPQLKEILICPNCHGELEENEPQAKLRCTGCGLAFPVRDGIPVMLIDEAEKPEGFEMRNGAAGVRNTEDIENSGAA
jgi:uncharacterized protein YbaR (Trm112 family)